MLDVSTQYWYTEEPGETVIDDLSEIMAGVLLNLTGAGIGVIPSGPEQGLALINNVSGSQYQALETFITNSFNGIDLETTGAHLVFMFFDNRMVLDPTKSGRIAVGDANTLGQITQQSLLMPSDGFFYVYTTTLSARNYYFDKLKIKRWKPQVRVSYDYYPYGMTWKNPDLQDEENRLHDHAYQDKEFLFGEYDGTVGLALYDFHARMYDPAIGRWLVPDPAEQFANPYLAMGNNPVSMIDPTGTMAWDDIAETDNDEEFSASDFDPERAKIPKERKVLSEAEIKALEIFYKESFATEMLQSDFDKLQSFDQSNFGHDTDPPTNSPSPILDGIQLGLDVFGLVPLVGELDDGVNALIYVGRGDYVNAGFSAAAMVPIAGWAATAGKLGNKAVHYSKIADSAHGTASTFNATTPIHSKIMFNELTQGSSKIVINTPKGQIVKADMGKGKYIQMRDFDKSGSHTTFDFIEGRKQVYEFKFNR